MYGYLGIYAARKGEKKSVRGIERESPHTEAVEEKGDEHARENEDGESKKRLRDILLYMYLETWM